MRRLIFVTACFATCVVAVPVRAAPVTRGVIIEVPPPAVRVFAMPEAEAHAFLSAHSAAVGLGVFPDSRSSADFLDQVGYGAPRGLTGEPGPLAGAPGKLEAALMAGGVTVSTIVLGGAERTEAAHLAEALPSTGASLGSERRVDVFVFTHGSEINASSSDGIPTIVVGVGARTPLLIGVLGTPGLLDHGVAERPGVVTPYDLAATIAKAAGVKPVPGGRALQVTPVKDPLHQLDVLRARFLRDRGFGLGLTGVTAGLAMLGAVFGVLFVILKRNTLAAALARAAAMIPAGYVGALFIPSSRWYVRSTVLVAAFVIGLAWPARSSKRFCGAVVMMTAVAIGVLTVVASKHPGGEPALSLWGDPLNSWRFFGIRNHLAAFLAGGFVLGSALLEAPLWLMVPGAAVAGVVVGAPTLGAQFIGVLTLAFGSALLLLGAIQKGARIWHIPVAIVVASGAAAGALLADAGRVYSHGGTAVESIRVGGWHTAWQFFRLRAHLNYNEIASLGPKGWITFVLVAFALAWLFVWGFRSSSLSPLLRAGVAGVAAAGMAALVVEDSGFLTAGIYLLYPALGFATGYADRALLGADLRGTPPAQEPPHSGDNDDDGNDHAHERE